MGGSRQLGFGVPIMLSGRWKFTSCVLGGHGGVILLLSMKTRVAPRKSIEGGRYGQSKFGRSWPVVVQHGRAD